MSVSQSDAVGLRHPSARPLPNVWGLVMTESSSQLASRYEDRSVSVATESALRQREERLRAAGPSLPAESIPPKRIRRGAAVDKVDSLGFYEAASSSSERDDDSAPHVAIGSHKKDRHSGAGGTRTGPVDLFHMASPKPAPGGRGIGATLAASGKRTLLTPPSLHAAPMQPYGSDVSGTLRGGLREIQSLSLRSPSPNNMSGLRPGGGSNRGTNLAMDHSMSQLRGGLSFGGALRTREILPPPSL